MPPNPPGPSSATLIPTLWLTLGSFAILGLTTYGSDPGWWAGRGVVHLPIVTTNGTLVTTNSVTNDQAVANQGQLKAFTAGAVAQLNSDFSASGGAGSALSNLLYGWQQDYATNGYATNPANPARPHKPSDFEAINQGQLKYIASLLYGRLSEEGYTGLTPAWLHRNAALDTNAANLGQLKETFNYDLSAAPGTVTGLTPTPGINQIDLNWTNPDHNNATGITIQQNIGGTWTDIATLGAGANSYSVTGLDPSQSYQFRIQASNPTGGTTTSSATSSAHPAPPIPPPPAQLAGAMDAAGTGHMILSWPAAAGATSYVVDREDIATGTWTTIASPGTTSYTDSGRTSGTAYRYRVSAHDGAGTSNPSAEFPPTRYAIIDLGAGYNPVAVNNNGDVAMNGYGPYFWHNGTATAMAGSDCEVNDLNDYGEMVGDQNVPASPDYIANGLYWASNTSSPSVLANGGYSQTDSSGQTYNSYAGSIANNGTIAGFVGQYNYTDINSGGDATWANAGAGPVLPYVPEPDLEKDFDLRPFVLPYNSDEPFPLPTDVDNHNGGLTRGTPVYLAQNRSGAIAWLVSQDTSVIIGDGHTGMYLDGLDNAVFTEHYPFFGDFQNIYSLQDGGGTATLPFSWLVNCFTSTPPYIYAGVDRIGSHLDSYITATYHLYDGGYDMDLGDNNPYAINTPSDLSKVELLTINDYTDVTCLYEKTTLPGAGSATWNFVNLQDYLPAASGWQFGYAAKINDSGVICGTSTKSSDGLSHGVLLVPIEIRAVNRDDPTQTWASNALQSSATPVYGGITAGDMISWKVNTPDSWSSSTFTWTVTDSSGNPVTDFNGTALTGPSGAGINEWRIATWSAGGNDPNNQWLTWKPGVYNVKCVISFSGGSTNSITFQQTVGTRAKDIVVIGWINPAAVSLTTSGVDSDVLSTFPSSGTFAGPVDRLFTATYVTALAAGIILRPITVASLSSADDIYILNWLFHFGGNSAPPSSFADQATLIAFENTPTNYKLFQRLQLRWQEASAKFTSPPIHINIDIPQIGTTTDPIFGIPIPGNAGPANDRNRTTTNDTYSQMNDGTPDGIAVAAFNTLMSPNKWSDIGSMISEGPSSGSNYVLHQQIYPTYNIYVRNSDGSFTQVDTKPQAANPSDNFSSTPYPPASVSWVIP